MPHLELQSALWFFLRVEAAITLLHKAVSQPRFYPPLSAEMFDNGEVSVEGKTVLELGAGAGLPSLICALVKEKGKKFPPS